MCHHVCPEMEVLTVSSMSRTTYPSLRNLYLGVGEMLDFEVGGLYDAGGYWRRDATCHHVSPRLEKLVKAYNAFVCAVILHSLRSTILPYATVSYRLVHLLLISSSSLLLWNAGLRSILRCSWRQTSAGSWAYGTSTTAWKSPLPLQSRYRV